MCFLSDRPPSTQPVQAASLRDWHREFPLGELASRCRGPDPGLGAEGVSVGQPSVSGRLCRVAGDTGPQGFGWSAAEADSGEFIPTVHWEAMGLVHRIGGEAEQLGSARTGLGTSLRDLRSRKHRQWLPLGQIGSHRFPYLSQYQVPSA